MRVIYNIAIIKVRALMFILKYFNSKIRSFNNERKNVLKKIYSNLNFPLFNSSNTSFSSLLETANNFCVR